MTTNEQHEAAIAFFVATQEQADTLRRAAELEQQAAIDASDDDRAGAAFRVLEVAERLSDDAQEAIERHEAALGR